MNYSSLIENFKSSFKWLPVVVLVMVSSELFAQSCPTNSQTTITTNPNTYYPGLDSALNAGSTAITLGAASSGTTDIQPGDLLLIIQMQGAQIDTTNTSSYGDGIAGGASGYLNNSELVAGNFEYIVATNAVPLSGGPLSILSGLTYNYGNRAFAQYGQYRYQIIRVGLYYDLTLGATITAPAWNGSSGGVVVLAATNNLYFNNQTVSAAGKGFRGGGGRQLAGATGGLNSDLTTFSTKNFNASKAEGIAGTPRFVNNSGVLLDNGVAFEGYPNGSYAAGAPGNAGGGGTDGRPSSNDQNSGGGGGANGGAGGRGGNSWSSNLATGGYPGSSFLENSPSRVVMGGGGGAGTTNNGTGVPSLGFASSGAAGGGIVIITAGIIWNSGKIDVRGANANTSVVNDGNGGGGAGGSVVIFASAGLLGIDVLASGGNGGSNSGGGSPPPHGPGGGGGGGVVYSNSPLSSYTTVAGGSQGVTTGGIIYGSSAGAGGILTQNVSNQLMPPQVASCYVLPLRFKSVNAKLEKSGVLVTWKVSNEVAVKDYTVERSNDGINYSIAGVIKFRYSLNNENTYTFTDNQATGGSIFYYRIRKNGDHNSIVYSTVVNVKLPEYNVQSGLSVSPNPSLATNANLSFTTNNVSAIPVQIRMVSANGVIVWQKQQRATGGVNNVTIDNLHAIPNGLYFVQYINGQERGNTQLIVRH